MDLFKQDLTIVVISQASFVAGTKVRVPTRYGKVKTEKWTIYSFQKS